MVGSVLTVNPLVAGSPFRFSNRNLIPEPPPPSKLFTISRCSPGGRTQRKRSWTAPSPPYPRSMLWAKRLALSSFTSTESSLETPPTRTLGDPPVLFT